MQHNLTLNSDYADDNIKGVTKSLRHRRGTVLLVWEHHSIVKIAKKLEVKADLAWPNADFDNI